MALRCIDCTKIDLQDQNKWGEYYCFETRSYVRGDSYTCRWFDQRDLGGCYLTTAFCHILGYKDDCYELEILRQFREQYLRGTKEGDNLLEEYETIGPKISNLLYLDPFRTDMVEKMGLQYIYPAISFINEGRFEDAKDTYIDMVNMLKERYHVGLINVSSIKIKAK